LGNGQCFKAQSKSGIGKLAFLPLTSYYYVYAI